MRSLLLVLALLPLDPGGRISWRSREEIDAALEEARILGLPSMVYVGASWCAPCSALDAGALSDDGVVLASEGLVRILVDLSKDRKIPQRFSDVRATPTILFLDPDGKVVETMKDRTPEALRKQIESVVAAHRRQLDLAGIRPRARTREEIAALWKVLEGTDGRKISEALRAMAESRADATAFLRERYLGKPAVDEAQRRLLAELDAEDLETRDRAATALAALGTDAEPALRAGLAAPSSAEQAARIRGILGRLEGPIERRRLATVLWIESLGVDEAGRGILEAIAAGDAATPSARRAKSLLAGK